MEFDDLMGALARQAGDGGDIPKDEDGVVRFAVGDITVAMMELPELGEMVIWSRMGELPAYGAEKLKTALLRGNFLGRDTGGATLSLSESDEIYLHRRLEMRPLDGEAFVEILTGFVQLMDAWRKIIVAYVPLAESEAEADGGMPSGEGFGIQV